MALVNREEFDEHIRLLINAQVKITALEERLTLLSGQQNEPSSDAS